MRPRDARTRRASPRRAPRRGGPRPGAAVVWQEGTMRVVRPGLIPNCERCEVAAGRGRQRFMYPMNIVVQYKIGTQVRYNAVDTVAAIEPPTDIPCPVPIGSSCEPQAGLRLRSHLLQRAGALRWRCAWRTGTGWLCARCTRMYMRIGSCCARPPLARLACRVAFRWAREKDARRSPILARVVRRHTRGTIAVEHGTRNVLLTATVMRRDAVARRAC